ncbi:hypothetical protein SUGI_0578830 [Cryptomeria japonica]|nr:hypothetical protein SUGI_0578830 [Cryptomeria japonica]
MEGLIPLVYRALRRHSSRRNYESLRAGEGILESHGHVNCFAGFSVENREGNGKGRFRKGKSLCLRMQDFGEEKFGGEKEQVQHSNEIVNRKRERLRTKSFAL